MPKFDRSSNFTKDISAKEWLDRLDYDFEIPEFPNPKPSLYLRAIAILLKGEPSKLFRSNQKMKSILANRLKSTEAEKQEVIDCALDNGSVFG